jgi:hypothetical protein
MALTTSLQADVDEVRQLATEYETLKERIEALNTRWTLLDHNSTLPEAEVIVESATAGDSVTEIPGVVGGDIKKAIAALNKRVTEALMNAGEDTDLSTSRVTLP